MMLIVMYSTLNMLIYGIHYKLLIMCSMLFMLLEVPIKLKINKTSSMYKINKFKNGSDRLRFISFYVYLNKINSIENFNKTEAIIKPDVLLSVNYTSGTKENL